MSDNITDGAEGSLAKKICAALSAAVILLMLSGCADKNEETDSAEAINAAFLPSVKQFSSEVQNLKEPEETTSVVIPIPHETESDSQTVSAGDAASSQTESETEISAETTVSETSAAKTSETSYQTTTTADPTETYTETVSETIPSEIVTECSVPMAQTAETAASDYSAGFFENDLFIGDSISTGYSLYGFLNDKNVFAKVGLNPSTVLTKTVATCYGEIGISDMLDYTMPERVYIMLGSNGIQWLSTENMLSSTDSLVKLINEKHPGTEVMIVSVPPVTPEYDASVEDINIIAKINEYNASLRTYCNNNGMLFIDAGSVLKNSEGYFDYAYAESDGMHFKYSAYKVLLSKIMSDVEAFEESIAAESEITSASAAVSDEISETETAAAAETEAPAETEDESETVTPEEEQTAAESEETEKPSKKRSGNRKNKKSTESSRTAEEKDAG